MPMLRTPAEKSLINTFSTFLSVEKTLANVIDIMMRNERLKRLLYYTDKHALGLPALNQQQSMSLLDNQIKIVPKLTIEPDTKPYVIIGLDNFVPMKGQTTFRSVQLSFDILCDYNYWLLDDFKLRPHAIAGEIDGMINNSFVNGSKLADFVGAKQLMLNEFLGGLSLYYNMEFFKDDTEEQVPRMEEQKNRY